MIAAGAVGAGVLLAARLLMRRLPAGMAEGLFVAVLTAVAALVVNARYGGSDGAAPGHTLTALAAIWLFASLVPAGDAKRTLARRSVFGHAALLCGAAAGVLALARPAAAAPVWIALGEPIERGGQTAAIIDFALLAVIAAAGAVSHRQPALWYGVGAAVVAALGLSGAAEWVQLQRDWLAPIAMMAAFAVGMALFLQGVAHWRVRSRFAVEAPRQLASPIGRPALLFAVVIASSLAVGTVFLLLVRSAWAPAACLAASLSCFTVAHRRGPQVAGDVGMVLTALAAASVVTGWLPVGDGGANRGQRTLLLAGAGVALGGLHALWLAGFWHQQLHDGVAWTTAGRMIPRARRTAQAAATACAVLIGAAMLTAWPGFSWTALFAGLLPLALVLRLFRDAGPRPSRARKEAVAPRGLGPPDRGSGIGDRGSGLEQTVGIYCAWPAAVAASLVLGASTNLAGSPLLILGLLSVLVALRYSGPTDDPRQMAHTAWIAGILPVGLLYLGILRIESFHWTWAASAGLILLANVLLRSKRSAEAETTNRPEAAGPQVGRAEQIPPG